MKLSELDYELPAELVAERPADRRDEARLLVHDVARDATEHRSVSDLPALLAPGDLLVVNDTRVLPARLYGRRATGGAVEILLLEPAPGRGRAWRAMANPARRLKAGERLSLEGGRLEARLVEREGDEWIVELADPSSPETSVEELLELHGRMPLPPYLRRGDRSLRLRPPPRDATDALDRERYQTVYAERPGAVAAPTAGLHFTPELLAELEARGVRRAAVTLHVGAGTFRPIESEVVEEHVMHAERFVLPERTAREIREARARGGRVVAVGTTSVRVLETRAAPGGLVEPGSGETRLFLLPGSPFRVADALLTNFHLPRSSLLALVAAFAGRERILRLYRQAVERRYRFYSYGDAMLFVGRPRDG